MHNESSIQSFYLWKNVNEMHILKKREGILVLWINAFQISGVSANTCPMITTLFQNLNICEWVKAFMLYFSKFSNRTIKPMFPLCFSHEMIFAILKLGTFLYMIDHIEAMFEFISSYEGLS